MEGICKLSVPAADTEFCDWVQIGIDVYIPHRNYQVKPHSSPWLSAACAAAVAYRNHFFHLYQQNNLLHLKQNLDRLVIIVKGFLKLLNLLMSIKQESLALPRNLALVIFGKLLIVFSIKVNLLYLLYLTDEVLSSAFDNVKLFAKNFSKNSNLDDSSISLPTFPSKTTLKLYDVHVTLQLVKQVITNLDFSKVLDCMVVLVLKKCEPKLLDIVAELFNMCLTKSKLLEVLISGQCI